MHPAVEELAAFYCTPLGRVVRAQIRAELRQMWPRVTAERVVGIGHVTPYLRPLQDDAERVCALMPAASGVLHWPREGPNKTALAHETALPLPDSSVDKVLMIHLLENTKDPFATLREAWRLLVPGGRLIAIVPYRSGPWARADHTPFGLGRPYSRFQLSNLISSAMFEVVEARLFLFTPPSQRRFVLGATRGWERVGRRVWPRFAGMLAVEAEKTLMRAVPTAKASRSLKIFAPALRPAATAMGGPTTAGGQTSS